MLFCSGGVCTIFFPVKIIHINKTCPTLLILLFDQRDYLTYEKEIWICDYTYKPSDSYLQSNSEEPFSSPSFLALGRVWKSSLRSFQYAEPVTGVIRSGPAVCSDTLSVNLE